LFSAAATSEAKIFEFVFIIALGRGMRVQPGEGSCPFLETTFRLHLFKIITQRRMQKGSKKADRNRASK
jgi:hypothetical protein